VEGKLTKHRFDALIIGSGQAGPSLAARFSNAGKKVAIVERKHFGGTCVNTGCMPTKALVASAYVAHMARRAAEYGINAGSEVTADIKRVMARKNEIVMQSRQSVASWMERLEHGAVFRGHARFTAPKTVKVNDDVIEAEHIFINTGGRASVPDMPGLDDVPYLTNSSILETGVLPEHLIVVGGSYIGLEFAQAFRRFGSGVTIIEMADRLIAREDDDVCAEVADILESEGIDLRLNAKCLSAEKKEDGFLVNLGCGDGARRISGSHLLMAVGRKPNTDDLGLEAAGVETDSKGYVIVDDHCRTNVKGVWAVGDVNGRGAFTHTSYNDYEIVAANVLDGEARAISDRIPCYGLFIDPPLGRVGMTEKEVRAKGVKALVAKRMMTSVGRAKERGETRGFMKVIVDAASQKILGAAILGINGDEVVHAFLDVMAAGAPHAVISRTMHIHPTVAEYLPTILQDLKPLG
jgi:pyruvate/2-oxoglutarate dehydrogenase complex dihydrolipoamide dehydrogenase (E3) component